MNKHPYPGLHNVKSFFSQCLISQAGLGLTLGPGNIQSIWPTFPSKHIESL